MLRRIILFIFQFCCPVLAPSPATASAAPSPLSRTLSVSISLSLASSASLSTCLAYELRLLDSLRRRITTYKHTQTSSPILRLRHSPFSYPLHLLAAYFCWSLQYLACQNICRSTGIQYLFIFSSLSRSLSPLFLYLSLSFSLSLFEYV